MGLFGSLFGKQQEYQPLSPGTPPADLVERHRSSIEAFAGKVKDRLELVPTEQTLYVFVGKPPDAFGVVWLRGNEEHNFKTLMMERGLSPQRVQVLSDNLRSAYVRHREDPRFAATIAGKSVVVTPSEAFARDVEKIIQEV